jgi:hypothetical protein
MRQKGLAVLFMAIIVGLYLVFLIIFTPMGTQNEQVA